MASFNLSVDHFLFEFSSFDQKTEKSVGKKLKISSFFSDVQITDEQNPNKIIILKIYSTSRNNISLKSLLNRLKCIQMSN